MTESLHTKLHAVQQELKTPKDLKNDFGGYSYRSAEEILSRVKPIAGRLGLTVHLTDSIELVGDRYYVKAKAMITDGKDRLVGIGYAREALSKKGMDDAQVTGAASSYARKYALQGLLAIDDASQDPDGKKPDEKTDKIDHNMATRLNDLLEETDANKDEFFKHYKVSRVHELTIKQFENAVALLTAKKAKQLAEKVKS